MRKPGPPSERKRLEVLEALYADYNRRAYISPDPLEFLYRYDSRADREVVGLIASSLAYGRVASILASVGRIMTVLGSSPADALADCDEGVLCGRLGGFVHRFTESCEMAKFLYGIGRALREHGSLENLFCLGWGEEAVDSGESVLWAMDRFSRSLLRYAGLSVSHLLPCSSRGSACKRLALYIRWMVRKDDVDPGGWERVLPADILVPLDTHMFRIATGLGFVTRKNADGKAALEATECFRAINPEDPVKYDFALTRFGIRTGMSVDELLAKFR